VRLKQMQHAFACALFDSALEPQALPLFQGDAQQISQRFALYRGNLTGTWNKTLSAAYPVLQALVGDEFFSALSRQYGKTYPSQDGDLNQFGDRFADFLAHFPHVAQYPYFPDMARLEWGLHRAYYAPDVSALTLTEVGQYSASQLDQMRLIFHPACQIQVFEWAVVELWRAHQPQENQPFPEQLALRNYGLIVRPRWQVKVLPLTCAAYTALSALYQGSPLGAALDAALDVEPEFDFASCWQQWLQHEVFTTIHPFQI